MHKDFKQHQRRETQLLAKIGQGKTDRQRKRAIKSYLTSYSSKFVSLELARQKKDVPVKDIDWDKAITRLDLWKAEEKECVQIIAQGKEGSGGDELRYTFSFKVINTARQILLKSCLSKLYKPHRSQFVLRGGRDVAIKTVQAYYAEGYTHICELDLNSAFHSFGTEEIARFLKLPGKVVENTLGGKALKIVPSTSISQIIAYADVDQAEGHSKMDVVDATCLGWRRALEGLTEGNCASPVACEMLLAWVCEKLPQDWPEVRLVNYADNFLIMATSANDVQHAVVLLREYLSEHPAAPPNKPITATTDFSDHGKPFPFLGYWLEPRSHGLVANASNRGFSKLADLRCKALHKCRSKQISPDSRSEILNEVWHKQVAIVGGYSLWLHGTAHIKTKTRKLYQNTEPYGVSLERLSKPLRSVLQV